MEFSKTHKAQVWSCGGGTQSCAIAALIVQGKLPKPDFSVIADTGLERGKTWDYMDSILVPELAKIGVVLHRLKASDYAYKHDGIFSNGGDPLIPAFTSEGVDVGKMSGYCNRWWKQDVIMNWFRREHKLTRSALVKWIGFSLDETTRAVRMMTGEEWKSGLIRFPLIHDFQMRRRDAIRYVESVGWPTPPRSACWMCPNQGDSEWRELKEVFPEEFQKAVELERNMQSKDCNLWLHKSCIPLDQVDFSQPEDLFSRPCDSGLCFV